MQSALIISNFILWLTVIGLSVLVFALTRQVGVLHERVAPAGALTPTSGPKIGESTTALATSNLAGGKLTIGGASEGASLVFFRFAHMPGLSQSSAHRKIIGKL